MEPKTMLAMAARLKTLTITSVETYDQIAAKNHPSNPRCMKIVQNRRSFVTGQVKTSHVGPGQNQPP